MGPPGDGRANTIGTAPAQHESLRAGEPLISVVIPVYQVEELLNRCVDSVLRQAHSNIEVILVDDGSTDRSGAICDEYGAADPRVVVVHQENRGLSDARNAGLEIARGEWLTFVDSDDWIHEEMLKRLLERSRQDRSDLAVCGLHVTRGNDVPETDLRGNRSRVLSRSEAMHGFLGALNVTMAVACAKLYRKELFNGIRFPSGRFHEDEFTTYKVVWNATLVSVLETPLYYYWQRPDSIMSTPSPQRITDTRDAMLGRAMFFHAAGMEAAAVSIVQTYFWKRMRQLRLALADGEDGVPGQVRTEAREIRGQATGLALPAKFRFALLAAWVAPRSLLRHLHRRSLR